MKPNEALSQNSHLHAFPPNPKFFLSNPRHLHAKPKIKEGLGLACNNPKKLMESYTRRKGRERAYLERARRKENQAEEMERREGGRFSSFELNFLELT